MWRTKIQKLIAENMTAVLLKKPETTTNSEKGDSA